MSQRQAEKENATQSNNTTKIKIIDAVVEVVKNLTTSTPVEIAKIAGTTIETIVKELSESGDKPAAILLEIAVLILATSVPMFVLKLSPSQINPPVETSQVKQLE
jgi:hypothetical protein